jgi:hypothetical protein
MFNIPGSYTNKDGVRGRSGPYRPKPPTPFPRMTYSLYVDPSGFSVYNNTPYFQSNFMTVTLTVTALSGTGSKLEVVSYPTSSFGPGSYIVQQEALAVGTNTYYINNPTPERYNSIQILKAAGNSFTITSFIINGTEQLVPPNMSPFVQP